MKRILLLLAIFVFISPGILFAEFGQRMSVDGYSVHISATKLSKKLVVSGTVKGGDICKLLKLSIRLVDDDGHTEYITAVIEDYKRSGRFSIKEPTYGGNRWKITDVRISKY
ncbi:MAG: hypothetical protein V6Z89_14365 [Desulfobacter sp.]